MRDMTRADVDAVWAIEQSVQAYPWTRGNFLDALDGGYRCVVEEREGEIAGYAIVMTALDEAELLDIAVAANRQRQGLGQALLRGLLGWAGARGMRRVFLEVRADNAPAVALYRRAGFAQVGLRRGYYHDARGNEDALLMACELTGGAYG